jgi:hypothetical protein
MMLLVLALPLGWTMGQGIISAVDYPSRAGTVIEYREEARRIEKREPNRAMALREAADLYVGWNERNWINIVAAGSLTCAGVFSGAVALAIRAMRVNRPGVCDSVATACFAVFAAWLVGLMLGIVGIIGLIAWSFIEVLLWVMGIKG